METNEILLDWEEEEVKAEERRRRTRDVEEIPCETQDEAGSMQL